MLVCFRSGDAKSTYAARGHENVEEQQVRAHEQIADFTECPRCVAEHRTGAFADSHFNHGNDLWAVCSPHQVRWYVTRRLLGIQEAMPGMMDLPEVESVYRCNR